MMLKDRIQKALEIAQQSGRGKTKSGLARYCKVSTSSVSDWFSGNSKSLSAEHVFLVADYLGVSALWLATGEGQIRQSNVNSNGFIPIPESQIAGVEIGSDKPKVHFSVIPESDTHLYPINFLKDKGVDVSQCRRLRVSGDTMAPLICHNDIVLIDCSSTVVVDGAIYALLMHGKLQLRKVYMGLATTVSLMPFNKDAPVVQADLQDHSKVIILGKVIDRSGLVS